MATWRLLSWPGAKRASPALRKDIPRQRRRDICYRHLAQQPQERFPIHQVTQLIQRLEAQSSCLLCEALEQETIHE
jgi:hypothetical protein